jgi:enamine deaminase RidA (YjgF/YER057c/UK114 family)
MRTVTPFNAPGVFEPPAYTQAIKVHQAQTILFLSGQVAYTAEGGVAHAGDFKAQARGAYQAIKDLVESQGGTMANVVKITTYLTDMRYRADLAPVREEFFGKKAPASTMVQVSALAYPDWMIEIEAIAVI